MTAALRDWSLDDLARFPFPFPADNYRYSANVEPATGPTATLVGSYGSHHLDVDRHYVSELGQRDEIIARDETRHAVLRHMRAACWDALLTVLEELTRVDPAMFTLQSNADGSMTWTNRLRAIERTFWYGDEESLGEDPLLFASRNVQEDIVLLDQREGSLWVDAGVVTFAADWSMGFDVGMSYPQIHGPVPRVHAEGIIERAHQFLMRLSPGEAFRRTNWTLTVDGHLDTSTERYDEWGPDRRSLHDGPRSDVGSRLFLRVEVQHLIRLRRSGAVMFLIRSYLAPLEAIAAVPAWAERTLKVLAELPDDLTEYKGLALTRGPAVDWLRDVAHAGGCAESQPARTER